MSKNFFYKYFFIAMILAPKIILGVSKFVLRKLNSSFYRSENISKNLFSLLECLVGKNLIIQHKDIKHTEHGLVGFDMRRFYIKVLSL